MVELTCHKCKKPFKRYKSLVKTEKSYCSRKCSNDAKYKHGLNARGYKVIKHNGKQVYEHRVIMEQHICRKLLKCEHVHHKNGKKDDNRIENLILMGSKEHQRMEHRPTYDINLARRLRKMGCGYKRLSKIFGIAPINIRNSFIARGWHNEVTLHRGSISTKVFNILLQTLNPNYN